MTRVLNTTVCSILSVCTQVSQWYELVVFTASMEIYGSAVADKLDNNRNILKRRYYRQVLLDDLRSKLRLCSLSLTCH